MRRFEPEVRLRTGADRRRVEAGSVGRDGAAEGIRRGLSEPVPDADRVLGVLFA